MFFMFSYHFDVVMSKIILKKVEFYGCVIKRSPSNFLNKTQLK